MPVVPAQPSTKRTYLEPDRVLLRGSDDHLIEIVFASLLWYSGDVVNPVWRFRRVRDEIEGRATSAELYAFVPSGSQGNA